MSGFWNCLKLLLRREHINSTFWIIGLTTITVIVAAAFTNMFPTQEDVMTMWAMMATPAMEAIMGPAYGLEDMTPAIIMSMSMMVFMMITVAVMNIFFVNRHTRGDEEVGRLEMLRALPVGKLTSSIVALFSAFMLNLIITLSMIVFILLINLEGTTFVGAVAYSTAIGAVGLLFACITLLVAQVFPTAHGVGSFSMITLGIVYIMRVVGLGNVSPIGLGLQVSAFYENDFTPIIFVMIQSFTIAIIALVINARRDHGAGLIAAKRGRSHASKSLQTPFGLAWRLTKGSIIGWCIAMFVLGATYGVVVEGIEEFVSTNEMFRRMLEGGANSIVDEFMAMVAMVMSLIALVPVINICMRIRTEESRGRIESIFTRCVRRKTLLYSYLFIAIITSIAIQLLTATGLYIASAHTGLVDLTRLLKISAMYLPAIWVVAGLSMLCVGHFLKLKAIVWGMFGYSFAVLYFGRLLDLPEWLNTLTPFGHIPNLDEFTWLPIILLCILAILLTWLGKIGYEESDLT